MPSIAQTIAVAAGAYLVGCANAGFYLVRLRTGRDIRTQGTGNAGARNVGRMLGRTGFVVVFALDALKGAVVAVAASLLVPDRVAMGIAVVAVVLGHIFPIQLQRRGGKGVSTAFGAILVLMPRVAIATLIAAAILALLARNQVFGGVLAFILVPAVAWKLGYTTPDIITASAVTMILLFTHRDALRDIAARITKRAARRSDVASAGR
jgi:glycerol-3-phosphate acyltransferase PlsY